MNHFICDSGAFSVWNRGLKIDLDDYIRFCNQYPHCDVFVNLDIIPGRPNDPKSLTTENMKAAAMGGWRNYQTMLRTLPFEKVVPVFHMGDDFKWLERYMDFGTPYIGISPANDRTTDQKMAWLQEVKKYIVDSTGKLLIKTHGFAVTSFRLMKTGVFHSVDSASWVRQSAYGTIYIPHLRHDEFIYSESPFLLSVSPKSPSRDERQAHITTLSPTVKQMVDRYLQKVLKMEVGDFEIVDVPEGYKREDGELWYLKGCKKQILRIKSKGLMTCHQMRFWANMKFLQNANKVLPVDHIYFAGAGGSLIDQIEYRLGRRLMSYHEIVTCKKAKIVFEEHMRRAAERSVSV